jgi:hypothetical protein
MEKTVDPTGTQTPTSGLSSLIPALEALCYKSEGCGFDSLEIVGFFIYLILPAAL